VAHFLGRTRHCRSFRVSIAHAQFLGTAQGRESHSPPATISGMEPNPYESPKEEASQSTFRRKRLASRLASSAGMIFGVCLVISAFSTFTIRLSKPPQFYLADNVTGVALVLSGLVAAIAGAIGWTKTRR
jgi:hypothetical protein